MSDDVSTRRRKVVPLSPKVLCFGPFRFDLAASRLYRGDVEIHLVPKACAVFEILLAHPGEIVTKEEFLEAVWEGIHVSDESLTQAISTIRQALGDPSHSPEYVQTLPTKGYRFIAPVSSPSSGSIGAEARGPSDAGERITEVLPPTHVVPAIDLGAGTGSNRRRGVLPWAVAVASLLIAVGVWFLGPSSSVSDHPRRVTRFTEALPPGRELFVSNETHRRWGAAPRTVALSPNGTYLAYVARESDGPWRLYLRPLSEDESVARPVPGSDGARSPFFSPDGEWVGFAAGGWLYRVPVAGGLPQPICEAAPRGASWGPDGTVVYDLAHWSALGITPLAGPPDVLTTLGFERRETDHLDPVFLPGGQAIMYTLWPGDAGGGRDYDATGIVTLPAGETKLIMEHASAARYLPPGYLAFVRAGQLLAQAFDLTTFEASGSPVAFYETERGLFAVSASGDLAYIPKRRTQTGSEVVWVDSAGETTHLVPAQHVASQVSVSPDGGRVALALVEPSGVQDIWILDAAGKAASIQVTVDGVAALPEWSPDGEWALYKSNRNGPWETFRVRSDGTGEAELLIAGASSQWVNAHPRDNVLVFGRAGDIRILDLDSDESPRLLFEEEGEQTIAEFSPAGRWLAYTSNEEGAREIFVRSYPDLAQKRKVSQGGGTDALWAPDGSEIFYHNDDQMMAVAIEYEPDFSAGVPRVLFPFAGRFSRPTGDGDYDVALNGQFVMIKTLEEQVHTKIEIVLNWVEEIKELIPPGGRQPRP